MVLGTVAAKPGCAVCGRPQTYSAVSSSGDTAFPFWTGFYGFSPCQVLQDVNTQICKAVHPPHCNAADVEGGVGLPQYPAEVHQQLFNLAEVQLEAVLLTPRCQILHLLSVGCLVIVGAKTQHHHIIGKPYDGVGALFGSAVMAVEGVEQSAKCTTLWSSFVECDGNTATHAYYHLY